MPVASSSRKDLAQDDNVSSPSTVTGPPRRPHLNTNISSDGSQAWLYSSPHTSALPSSPSSSMIGPPSSFYDQDQALAHDSHSGGFGGWGDAYGSGGGGSGGTGFIRTGHGAHFQPQHAHHIPRSTAATEAVQQPSPLQNQYHFVTGHYTPPPPPPSAGGGHYTTVDVREGHHYAATSPRSQQSQSQPIQFQTQTTHHDTNMYYYPTISTDLVGSPSSQQQQPQAQSYTYTTASNTQYHSPAAPNANPSPYTPASELSVTLPSHSSVSPASWTEEMPGVANLGPSKRQPPYRHPQPQPSQAQKRDRAATNPNPPKPPKSRKRARKSAPDAGESGGDSDSDDDSDGPAPNANTSRGPEGMPTRLPGACTHCKKLKMKCDFPKNENTCKRCKAGGHHCVVEGRKPRTAPNKREYLLAQIRQKDTIIESLLKQLHNPYVATPLSIASYKLATSPSDQNNSNIIAWLDRLQSSVRAAAPAQPAQTFKFETRPHVDEESESDSDRHQGGEEDDGGGSGEGPEADQMGERLPDAAAPLGLIANLSLSNSKARKGKGTGLDADEGDDNNVGVANETYFMPGPATDLGIRASLIEKHSPPEILVHGLVAPEDVEKLFQIFFERINVFISILDPVLHTPTSTFARCPFLFTVICAISSRYYTEKSEIYPIAMHFAKHSAANALIDGWKSVELCQAYILMSIYAQPAKRWEEDRSWLYTGLAIRIATDLNLHQVTTTKPQNERHEREILNRTRVWLICFTLDRSTATQFGKPSTIKEDFVVRNSKDWYKRSIYNQPFDVHLCAYVCLLRIVGRFHDEIFSDPDAPTGLNKAVNFRSVTATHDAHLTDFYNEWSERFAQDSNSSVPGCAFRCSLLPFMVGYARLVMYSFGFQQAFLRGLEPGDDVFFSRCLEAAKTVVKTMVESLAPSGYMRSAADGNFVFASFASAFLLKLLRPEFAHLLSKEEETEIFDLITRLIQTLSSPEVAVDDRHTPKLYARFLASLLARHRRDGSTTGRLHPLPPPQNLVQGGHSAPYGGHAPSTSTQTTFSVTQPQADSQQGQRQDGGYSRSVFSVSDKTETIYRPQPTTAFGSETLDFGGGVPIETVPFNFNLESPNSNGVPDDETLATMQTLKNPAWWQNMMMPGFSWPEAQAPTMNLPSAESYMQHLHVPSNLHNTFGTFHAPEVPLH